MTCCPLWTSLLSRAVVAFSADIVWCISVEGTTSKNCLFPWEFRLPPNTWFLGPIHVHNPAASRSVQVFLKGWRLWPADTDRPCYTGNSSLHLMLHIVMPPNNDNTCAVQEDNEWPRPSAVRRHQWTCVWLRQLLHRVQVTQSERNLLQLSQDVSWEGESQVRWRQGLSQPQSPLLSTSPVTPHYMGFVDIVIWYRLFAYSLANATAIPKPHHFCLIKIHNGLTFLALAYQGCPGKNRPLKWKMVIIYICSVLQPWELMVCIVTMYCSAKHSIRTSVYIHIHPVMFIHPSVSPSEV